MNGIEGLSTGYKNAFIKKKKFKFLFKKMSFSFNLPQFSNSLPWVNSIVVRRDFFLFKLKSSSFLFDTIKVLKQSTFFQQSSLLDIVAVDYPTKTKRFEITYILLSVQFGFRTAVRTQVCLNEGLSTITGLFTAAAWLEREIWDMFGVFFFGSNDLRRILTDYGFRGHPLRKDFPLTGYLEIRYSDEEQAIVHESVQLTQEFRVYKFTNPYINERWRKL